jgi:hypothetical protein
LTILELEGEDSIEEIEDIFDETGTISEEIEDLLFEMDIDNDGEV